MLQSYKNTLLPSYAISIYFSYFTQEQEEITTKAVKERERAMETERGKDSSWKKNSPHKFFTQLY